MRLFSTEQISKYHPDKYADQISDAILTECLSQDKNSHCGIETMVKDNTVVLGGEITTNAKVDYIEIVRRVAAKLGYTVDAVINLIGKQSNEINEAVTAEKKIGAGDQGIMFGMAINSPETEYMPKDFYYAKKLGKALFESKLGGLDIKTQVVIDDLENVKKVIVAIPMKNDENLPAIKDIIRSIIPSCDYELIINGTGKYVKHSSIGDCGTTGRKLAVDFYGGNCNVGGGSPWTKDGTKADLTLNMYARKLALDYVKENNVPFAKVGIGCCIGKSEVDITIWNEKNEVLKSYSKDVKPSELIEMFNLKKPIFAKLCREGLFSEVK